MPIEEVPPVTVTVMVPEVFAAPREPSKFKPVKPLRDRVVNCEVGGVKLPKLHPLGTVQEQALPVLRP